MINLQIIKQSIILVIEILFSSGKNVIRFMSINILIVDDEREIADLVEVYLKNEGFTTFKFYNGQDAMECVSSEKIELAILDIMLPDIDGFTLCRRIRENYNFPIIMLTAKEEEIDKINGLTLGADDYITKPFEIKEVVVRVKALFRSLEKENKLSEEALLELENGIIVDQRGERVFKDKMEVALKRKEWELFSYLLKNRNHVFSREELLANVWGYDYYGDSRTVDVHIRRLRAKLCLEKETLIETVFGKGYVMR